MRVCLQEGWWDECEGCMGENEKTSCECYCSINEVVGKLGVGNETGTIRHHIRHKLQIAIALQSLSRAGSWVVWFPTIVSQ